MKKYFTLLILIAFALCTTEGLHAQKKRKSKKNKEDKGLYIPQKDNSKRQGPFINPVRKVLNMFNFSFEMGGGYFNYQQEFTDVVLVRTTNPASRFYIIPTGNETSNGPYDGFSNWFNGFTPITINQINDDDIVLRTSDSLIVYKNSGSYIPITLRVSVSVKKTDKKHLKTTGERKSLDEDFLRIGAGIGFGKIKYKNNVMSPSMGEPIGDYAMPITEAKQSKLFASIDVNVYSKLDHTLFLNLEAGTWQFKRQVFNEEVTQYDPFYSVGLTFEKKVSKYFKLYIKPAVELRNYSLNNQQVNISNKMTMFSINIGALIKYPTYPRNKFKSHRVQMEHVFNGKMYRGRSIFRKQNPRIGQNYQQQKNR